MTNEPFDPGDDQAEYVDACDLESENPVAHAKAQELAQEAREPGPRPPAPPDHLAEPQVQP